MGVGALLHLQQGIQAGQVSGSKRAGARRGQGRCAHGLQVSPVPMGRPHRSAVVRATLSRMHGRASAAGTARPAEISPGARRSRAVAAGRACTWCVPGPAVRHRRPGRCRHSPAGRHLYVFRGAQGWRAGVLPGAGLPLVMGHVYLVHAGVQHRHHIAAAVCETCLLCHCGQVSIGSTGMPRPALAPQASPCATAQAVRRPVKEPGPDQRPGRRAGPVRARPRPANCARR